MNNSNPVKVTTTTEIKNEEVKDEPVEEVKVEETVETASKAKPTSKTTTKTED